MTPPAWLLPAIPFFAAFVTQLLSILIRWTASAFSTSHFRELEKAADYVPDSEARKHPRNRIKQDGKSILPPEYHSESIGAVYAKNGDGAALLTGSVTLLSTWLSTALSTGVIAAIVTGIVLLIGIAAGVRLWRMDVENYKPGTLFGVSTSVAVLLAVFLVVGVAIAVLSSMGLLLVPTGATPSPNPSTTP